MSKPKTKKPDGKTKITIGSDIKGTSKKPMGRPTKYNPDYCNEIIDWFQSHYIPQEFEIKKPPIFPTIERFATNLGVCKDTLYEWGKIHPDFSVALKKAHEIQQAIWQEGSMRGLFPPAFTIFLGKNVFGWKDKQDITASVESQADLSISVNFVDSERSDNQD